jgi:hypothetical protein
MVTPDAVRIKDIVYARSTTALLEVKIHSYAKKLHFSGRKE